MGPCGEARLRLEDLGVFGPYVLAPHFEAREAFRLGDLMCLGTTPVWERKGTCPRCLLKNRHAPPSA